MPKPSLLLLHGALGAASQFDLWIPHFPDSIHVFAPELEGHGLTAAADRPFRMETFAANLQDFIRQHALVKPWLFGYSMGGYVGLTLEQMYPGTFGGIFTLATKFDWNPAGAAQEVKGLNAEKIEEKVPAFAQQLNARHPAFGWKNVLAATAEMMLHLGGAPVLTAESLGTLRCPVRITVGDRDKMVSIEESAGAYRSIAGAQFQVHPHTPHPLEQVQVNPLVREIMEFMAEGIPQK